MPDKSPDSRPGPGERALNDAEHPRTDEEDLEIEPAGDHGDDARDLRGLFKVWIASDAKVQLLVFYRNNPGVMETAEGLATRLGLSREALLEEITDHVSLGIVRERVVGKKKIYVYNRGAERDVEEMVKSRIEDKLRGDDT